MPVSGDVPVLLYPCQVMFAAAVPLVDRAIVLVLVNDSVPVAHNLTVSPAATTDSALAVVAKAKANEVPAFELFPLTGST